MLKRPKQQQHCWWGPRDPLITSELLKATLEASIEGQGT